MQNRAELLNIIPLISENIVFEIGLIFPCLVMEKDVQLQSRAS